LGPNSVERIRAKGEILIAILEERKTKLGEDVNQLREAINRLNEEINRRLDAQGKGDA